jgi:hypothetical protein
MKEEVETQARNTADVPNNISKMLAASKKIEGRQPRALLLGFLAKDGIRIHPEG